MHVDVKNTMNHEMNPSAFADRLLALAEQQGVSPAEIALSSSESFSVRVRAGKLEDYKVSDRFRLTLRGLWQGRIGTASRKHRSLDLDEFNATNEEIAKEFYGEL